MSIEKSESLFARAQKVMPGGVSSPVRAFKSVGGSPIFFENGKGCMLTDVDGNRYIDFVASWGPLILGYSPESIVEKLRHEVTKATSFGAPCKVELECAELIVDMVPSVEMVRMVNSGTEATMSALRLARAYTGRQKLIKFAGCYHGHFDSFLIQAGSGATTLGVPNSPGVSKATANDTLLAEFNDLSSVREAVKSAGDDLAAIILEPVAANMGLVPPKPGFLEALREICDETGAVLIFDEVMTGFRLGKDGAQGRFGVRPDLTTFGKVIGGGLPVGAYGGSKKIMEKVAPSGPMYQAGTLSGNPLAMRCGLETLKEINNPGFFETLEDKSSTFESFLRPAVEKHSDKLQFTRLGSMLCLFFNPKEVSGYQSALESDTKRYGEFFQYLLKNGVYFPPAQFEAFFISSAHTEADLKKAANVISSGLDEVF